jgi:hypothetical protein
VRVSRRVSVFSFQERSRRRGVLFAPDQRRRREEGAFFVFGPRLERHADPPGCGGDEGVAFGACESQGVREGTHSVGVGVLPLAALDCADPLRSEAGTRGQLLLGEAG